MRGDRGLAAAVTIVLALLFFSTFAQTSLAGRNVSVIDFLVFSCAASVAAAGEDPYRTAPVAACERRTEDTLGTPPGLRPLTVAPPPVPPATILLFESLRPLPYQAALDVDAAIGALACAFAVAGLARLTSLPWWGVATTIGLTGFRENLPLGQLPPIGLAAFVLAAVAVRSGRPRLAGALAAVALIQPNVGLPVVAALVIWVPRARLTALAGTVAFAAAGLAIGGPAISLEYATQVVPAQALAETSLTTQFSLTWALWLAGATGQTAVRIGGLWYAVVVAAAVALAGPLARRLRDATALVFLPAAAAVTGGEYVHPNQLCFAVPLGLLLATAVTPRLRPVAWTAIVLVTMPFYLEALPVALLEAALVAVTVRFALPQATLERRWATGFAALFAIELALAGISHLPTAAVRPADPLPAYLAVSDLTLGVARRGADDRRNGTLQEASIHAFGSKLPAWSGLVVLLGLAVRTAKGNQSRAERG